METITTNLIKVHVISEEICQGIGIGRSTVITCTFKKGIGKPVFVYATDYEGAKREGLAYYKKNSGYVETVDLYSTVENTIECVELIED